MSHHEYGEQLTRLASIPSPSWSEWHIAGPFAIRAYAICIILGVIAAVVIGNRRWIARGGEPGVVLDMVLWAVPFGLVGARIYHVVTDYQLYFGEGRNPWRAFAITDGGLGIWGAIALGGVGVWIGCRRRGIPLPAMADAVAPGIAIAQAVGRFGNWFNQELFGGPTTLPWGLQIDPEHRPDGMEEFETFHPTFLYEAIWLVLTALIVIWVDRRFRLGHGRAFALYVATYTVGRAGMEVLRVDEANHFLGMRVNFWVSLVVFAGALVYLVLSARMRPGRETIGDPDGDRTSSPSGEHRAGPSDRDETSDESESVTGDGPADPTKPHSPDR